MSEIKNIISNAIETMVHAKVREVVESHMRGDCYDKLTGHSFAWWCPLCQYEGKVRLELAEAAYDAASDHADAVQKQHREVLAAQKPAQKPVTDPRSMPRPIISVAVGEVL